MPLNSWPYFLKASDSWVSLIDEKSALVSDWVNESVDIEARYFKVEVFGNKDGGNTQARELEILGKNVFDVGNSVTIEELNGHIEDWKAGRLSLSDLMDVIRAWESGAE